MSLENILRVAGATLIALSLFHAILWRVLGWDEDCAKLSPLNARVFAVHTFFIAFVLGALGLLSLMSPELLLEPSDLARRLLIAIVVFWIARLAIQPFVFDPVMPSWGRHPVIRSILNLVWVAYTAAYGAALAGQFSPEWQTNLIAPLDLHSHIGWLRLGIAAVWLAFGLIFKALGTVPRHRQIVARVVGETRAGLVLGLVAVAEIGIGLWMILGRHLVYCVLIQAALLAAMNVLEFRRARDLLLSPVGMVCANIGLLSVGLYVALSA